VFDLENLFAILLKSFGELLLHGDVPGKGR